MTNSSSDITPLPDAPISNRSLAELNLAMQAAEVSDNARGFIPFPDGHHDGTAFADALRFLHDAEELVAAVVIVERAHGVSWEDLARSAELAKSTVHKKWSPAESEWQARLDAEQQSLHPDSTPRPALGGDPERIAALLDAWMARHASSGDSPRGDSPVSALVTRMDPSAEVAFLSRQRSQLYERYEAPPPALLALLAEREAVLEEAMAEHVASPREAAKHRASAEKNRAYARELHRQAAT